jgi:hypothetical protein
MSRWFRIARWAAWILVAAALLYFVDDWLAPDACLDSGGSFDYKLWRCANESKPYVDVAVYTRWSFWVLVGCSCLALGLHFGANRAAPNNALERERGRQLRKR